MFKIAIIIPVHNGLSYTKECLKSLIEITLDPVLLHQLSIIVVDDGSSDGTEEWIRNNFPAVIVLNGDGNLWWSGGVNKGAKYAFEEQNFDYVLLWNNDIEIDKNYFYELIELVKKSDNNKIIGSKIIDANSEYIWSMGGIFNPKTGLKYMIGQGKPNSKEYEKIHEPDWLTGMGTLVPKKIIEKIGYWDQKKFPQYLGDCEFTYRAKLNGFKLIVYPNLIIRNDTSHTGLWHNNDFRLFIKSLYDSKSSLNLRDNFRFYKLYATSTRAYFLFIKRNLKFIGGFFKWKILHLFGYSRDNSIDVKQS